MSSDRPQLLKEFFRSPIPHEYLGASWVPSDPHAMWKNITPSQNFSRLPPQDVRNSLASTIAYGRIISTASPPFKRSGKFLMISLKLGVQRLPPHPGARPRELDEYNHPWYITTDGSLGPYDPLHYTQDFRPETPWTGFHAFPHAADEIIFRSPVEFFDWNGLQLRDMSGGSWKISSIRDLLRRRGEAETQLLKALHQSNDSEGKRLFRQYSSSLPFYDPLELTDCESWNRWADGRDAIGRTLRYIGELDAIKRWLREVYRQSNTTDEKRKKASPSVMYAGVWVGGVCSDEDWRFLSNSPLCLYGLFSLSEKHPLAEQAVEGSFDNDEFFRLDPFIFKISTIRTETPSIPRPDHVLYDGGFVPCPNYRAQVNIRTMPAIPNGLKILPPGGQLVEGTLRDFDHRQPYTTYLFMQSRFPRGQKPLEPSAIRSDLRKLLFTYSSLTATPYRQHPIGTDFGDCAMSYHPAMHVIPKRSPIKQDTARAFTENSISNYRWLEEISTTPSRYKFKHYISKYDVVWSNENWPVFKEIHPEHFEEAFHTVTKETHSPLVPAGRMRVYLTKEQADALDNNVEPQEKILLPPHKVQVANEKLPPAPTRSSAPSDPFGWSEGEDTDLEPIITTGQHKPKTKVPIHRKLGTRPPKVTTHIPGRNKQSTFSSHAAHEGV